MPIGVKVESNEVKKAATPYAVSPQALAEDKPTKKPLHYDYASTGPVSVRKLIKICTKCVYCTCIHTYVHMYVMITTVTT